MRTQTISAFVLAVGIAAESANGYPGEYGPFPPDAVPKPFPLEALVAIEPADADSNGVRHALTPYPRQLDSPTIHVNRDNENWSWMVFVEHGRHTWGPRLVSENLHFHGSWRADLNQDDRVDFVLRFWTGGCGLAALSGEFVLLLSAGDAYHVASWPTWSPGPEDFVDLSAKGICFVIHTDFVYGEPGRDGKLHNYWVYHLLEVQGSRLKPSTADQRFPKWIWYTFNPNHSAKTQLTEAQKLRLWKEQGTDFDRLLNVR